MARELPGFYFDTEKNRYFPVPKEGAAAGKGIPADGKRPQAKPGSDTTSGPSQEARPTLPPSQFSLLQRREWSGAYLYGRDAPHGRRFTSASWEAGFRDYTVWGFGSDPHFNASADSTFHGAGPFLQLCHGSRSILLAGDEHGLNALEPRAASEDPLSIRGVKILDSRPRASSGDADNNFETPGVESGATEREDSTASRRDEESSSEDSSSDDDRGRREDRYVRGIRRRFSFRRKRKRKARGVWRDTGQGLQRIDTLPPTREGHVRNVERRERGESSTQAKRKERCPVDLALLSSLPLQSRVTALRSAGRADDWGGDQRFIATTLGSNTTAGSFLLLRSREGDTWTEPVVRRHYFDKESIWTGDISGDGRQAVIGASTLGFRIQLETWAIRPLAPSNGSATLAQQFDSTGNLVLSGFRNGAISTVDLRAPPPQLRPLDGLSKPQRGVKVASHGTPLRMGSSVCDLRLLRTDENFLLASAMDGSLVQWDRRAARRPVRTFLGHRNSHTMLKMAVDPGERVVMSGGEDRMVKVWSLSSGGLLQEMGPFETPVTYLEWVASSTACNVEPTCTSTEKVLDLLSWGVWMGAQGSSLGPMLVTPFGALRFESQ